MGHDRINFESRGSNLQVLRCEPKLLCLGYTRALSPLVLEARDRSVCAQLLGTERPQVTANETRQAARMLESLFL